MNNLLQPCRIILDVDGTLLDRTTAIARHIGYAETAEEVATKWPKGKYDYKEVLDVDFGALPASVFEDTNVTPEATRLLALSQLFPVSLASKIWTSSASHILSISYFAGAATLPVTLCLDAWKSECVPLEVQAISLLIDDCDKEVELWGGPALLVPRPWNSKHDQDPLEFFQELFVRLTQGCMFHAGWNALGKQKENMESLLMTMLKAQMEIIAREETISEVADALVDVVGTQH